MVQVAVREIVNMAGVLDGSMAAVAAVQVPVVAMRLGCAHKFWE
jgi:hypothetical protein